MGTITQKIDFGYIPDPSLKGSRARFPHNDDVVVDDYDDGSKEEANTNTNHRNHFGRYVTTAVTVRKKLVYHPLPQRKP